MRYLAFLVQHMAPCEDSPWRIPCLKLPSSFVLKEETPEEKVIKAKSQVLQGGLEEFYCGPVFPHCRNVSEEPLG